MTVEKIQIATTTASPEQDNIDCRLDFTLDDIDELSPDGPIVRTVGDVIPAATERISIDELERRRAADDSRDDYEAALRNIPLAIRQQPRFVAWNSESRDGKPKPTKVPKNPLTGYGASSTDSNTWSDIETALRCQQNRNYTGIGFTFTHDERYLIDGCVLVGIDIDHCIDDSGNYSDLARSIISSISSYTELSPSGDGLHILALIRLDIMLAVHPNGFSKKNSEIGLEIYSRDRYFTATGQRIGTNDLSDCTAEILTLYREYFPEKTTKTTAAPSAAPSAAPRPIVSVSMDDQQLIDKAISSSSGQKFNALYSGSTQYHSNDSSSADLALCSSLAFWTQADAMQMDRIFRSSGLYRDKWDKKHSADGRTYGQMTIDRAVAGCTEVYNPSRRNVSSTEDNATVVRGFSEDDKIIAHNYLQGFHFERDQFDGLGLDTWDISYFDLSRNDNLLCVALGVIEIMLKRNQATECPIGTAQLAEVAGVSKVTAWRMLELLSPQGREQKLKRLQNELKELKLTTAHFPKGLSLDSCITIERLIEIMPAYQRDGFIAKLSILDDDKIEDAKINKIKSLTKRERKIEVDIKRLQNGVFPDLLEMSKVGNSRECSEFTLDLEKLKRCSYTIEENINQRFNFSKLAQKMGDDAFLRNAKRPLFERETQHEKTKSGHDMVSNSAATELQGHLISSYGRCGLRILVLLLDSDDMQCTTQHLCDSINKHPRTIDVNLERMVATPSSVITGVEMEPIIGIDDDGVVTLSPEWQERLKPLRQWMTTRDLTSRRQIRYTMERIKQLETLQSSVVERITNHHNVDETERYTDMLNDVFENPSKAGSYTANIQAGPRDTIIIKSMISAAVRESGYDYPKLIASAKRRLSSLAGRGSTPTSDRVGFDYDLRLEEGQTLADKELEMSDKLARMNYAQQKKRDETMTAFQHRNLVKKHIQNQIDNDTMPPAEGIEKAGIEKAGIVFTNNEYASERKATVGLDSCLVARRVFDTIESAQRFTGEIVHDGEFDIHTYTLTVDRYFAHDNELAWWLRQESEDMQIFEADLRERGNR